MPVNNRKEIVVCQRFHPCTDSQSSHEWQCYVGLNRGRNHRICIAFLIPMRIALVASPLNEIESNKGQFLGVYFEYPNFSFHIVRMMNALSTLHRKFSESKFSAFLDRFRSNLLGCRVLYWLNETGLLQLTESKWENAIIEWKQVGIGEAGLNCVEVFEMWLKYKSASQDAQNKSLIPPLLLGSCSQSAEAGVCEDSLGTPGSGYRCPNNQHRDDSIDLDVEPINPKSRPTVIDSFSVSMILKNAMYSLNALSSADIRNIRRCDAPPSGVGISRVALGTCLLAGLLELHEVPQEGGDGAYWILVQQRLVAKRLLVEWLVSVLQNRIDGSALPQTSKGDENGASNKDDIVDKIEFVRDVLSSQEYEDFETRISAREVTSFSKFGLALFRFCRAMSLSVCPPLTPFAISPTVIGDSCKSLDPLPMRTKEDEAMNKSTRSSDSRDESAESVGSGPSPSLDSNATTTTLPPTPSPQSDATLSRVHSILSLVRERARYR